MRKFIWLFIAVLSVSSAYGKVDKKKDYQNQKLKEGLVIEQKRLLDEIDALQKNIQVLKALQQERQVNLSKKQQEVSKSFPLLVRLGRVNSIKLLADPKTGQNTLRSIILMRALTQSLKGQIQQVQAELKEIEGMSKELEGREEIQQNLLQAIEFQKNQVDALEGIEDVKKKELDRLADVDDINTLLDESRAALSKVERSANTASKSKKLPFRRLERPVLGKIIEDKAIQNKYSPKSIGVVFETKMNAEVLSPSSGTIVFKGPFREQGEILILDHGKNVHSVFMGMDKINAYVGQKVYAREKLGTMAGYGSGAPKLYFELRQKGKAIDPKPYFTE